MIDEKIIMPFNFFKYGGRYSGEHNGMRYMLEPAGEKPDFILKASVWQGPYASTAVSDEEKVFNEFSYSEEGRKEAIEWFISIYEEKKELWDSAPSILSVKPIIHE